MSWGLIILLVILSLLALALVGLLILFWPGWRR